MTIAFWCVLVASLLPMTWIAYAKLSIGFNNRSPRADLEKCSGKPLRAKWAHDNSWEALIMFVAAVIIATYVGAEEERIDFLAVTFIGCRILYGFAYIYDKPTCRSIVWFGGLICIVGLYISAAMS